MGLAGKMEGALAAVARARRARPPATTSRSTSSRRGPCVRSCRSRRRGAAPRGRGAVKPCGKTAFFDALAKMPDRTLLGRNGSRAIVLLTDGIDNASDAHARGPRRELLQGVDVPVYPIGLRSRAPRVVPAPGDTPERARGPRRSSGGSPSRRRALARRRARRSSRPPSGDREGPASPVSPRIHPHGGGSGKVPSVSRCDFQAPRRPVRSGRATGAHEPPVVRSNTEEERKQE